MNVALVFLGVMATFNTSPVFCMSGGWLHATPKADALQDCTVRGPLTLPRDTVMVHCPDRPLAISVVYAAHTHVVGHTREAKAEVEVAG